MNNTFEYETFNYIETPRVKHTPEKIDAILERRMREFMLARRQKKWLRFGE